MTSLLPPTGLAVGEMCRSLLNNRPAVDLGFYRAIPTASVESELDRAALTATQVQLSFD